jgi:hypothetical protein
MRFIQPVGTPGIQVGIVVTQHHIFGDGCVQAWVGAHNGGEQAAKVDNNRHTYKQVKPFGLSCCLYPGFI